MADEEIGPRQFQNNPEKIADIIMCSSTLSTGGKLTLAEILKKISVSNCIMLL